MNKVCMRSGQALAHILGLFILLFAISSSAGVSNIQDAINKAGKQRMLTQRMLKEYTLVGMGVEYGRPKEKLNISITLFEQQLLELKRYPAGPGITDSLSKVEALWRPIKKIVSSPPDLTNIATLQRDMDALLQACHHTTQLLSEASPNESGYIINVSGRQRMLSQRLASLYMIRAWGLDDPEFSRKHAEVMEQFQAALQELEQSPVTTRNIKKKLKKVRSAFYWFEHTARNEDQKPVPTLITKSSDKILQRMDEITEMYASVVQQ